MCIDSFILIFDLSFSQHTGITFFKSLLFYNKLDFTWFVILFIWIK